MKKVRLNINGIMACLLFMLALVCFYRLNSLFAVNRFYSQTISIYDSHQSFAQEQVDALLLPSQKIGDVVVWREKSGENVQNETLNKQTDTDVLLTNGHTNLLFDSDIRLLDFDYQSCAISQPLAEELFGDTNVVGKSVKYNNQNFKVVSIVPKIISKLLIIHPQKNQSETFDTVTIVPKDMNVSPKTIQNKLNNHYQIKGKIVAYDIFNALVAVIILSLFGYLLMMVFREYISSKPFDLPNKHPALKYGPMIMLFVVLLALWLIILNRVVLISADWIPSKWSDFEFYGQLWEKEKQSIYDFMRMPKRTYEFIYEKNFLSILFYSVLVFILTKISARCIRKIK
ncbi:ABC transporter permease [Vagococcus silagei]|uniref:MacB-like periplasmic core domain-containing protein n=1 Tax=Vagococcus silagei TaxID=2508885 RepID=A0A4S3B4F9_9ENTE|nr:ABC transporter permease [Vagococcus silagei]THB60493.1 hypothetical protein ESZ54_09710 [Vagococcus silagei]